MRKNPVAAKIAAPYARAVLEYAIEKDKLYELTNDFKLLLKIIRATPQLEEFLKSPIITNDIKSEFLIDIFKEKISKNALNFMTILVYRNRADLIEQILFNYFELLFDKAKVKFVKIISPIKVPKTKLNKLRKKLEILTKSRAVRLVSEIDSTLVGGLLIRTKSKILDYTIKTKLQNLAKHLDADLEI